MTQQIEAWRGDFGTEYLARSGLTTDLVRSRVPFYGSIAQRLVHRLPKSILEVGSNTGINLAAIRQSFDAELFAVEPFRDARESLLASGILPAANVHEATGDKLPFADSSIDLVFTSGVLIHVNRDMLAKTMSEIVRVSRRFILCAEYFAPRSEEILYRGKSGLLWRDDYGGRYLDAHPKLELLDYGFLWKRFTSFDDCTWWLMEKRS